MNELQPRFVDFSVWLRRWQRCQKCLNVDASTVLWTKGCFDLIDNPQASRVYAWSHETGRADAATSSLTTVSAKPGEGHYIYITSEIILTLLL